MAERMLRADPHDPLPRRLSAHHPLRDRIMARHAGAIAQGRTAYLDPSSGLAVFTAAFLAERGYCCDSGCRHCPYEPAQR